MTQGVSIIMINPVQGHKALTENVWPWCKAMLMAEHRIEVTAKPAKRSTQQNRRMWAMLQEISQQVDWYGRKLTAEEWKHVFTAALAKQDVVPGIGGGFVVLGKSTSSMTVAEMSEMQTLMEAFGAEHDVRFSAVEAV
jgi:hypothetical protein